MTVWIVLVVVWLLFNAAVVCGGLVHGTRKEAALRAAARTTMRPAAPGQ